MNPYKTGNLKFDERVAEALKKDPLKKSRLQLLLDEEEGIAIPEERDGGKYGVAPEIERTYNGIVFASKREMERWRILEVLVKNNQISNLQRQVYFNLLPGFIHAQLGKINPVSYIADFVYHDLSGQYAGRMVVEDAKGVRTKEYAIKRKFFLNLYPDYIFLEV